MCCLLFVCVFSKQHDEAKDQKEYKRRMKDKRAAAKGGDAARALQWDDLMFVHQQQTQRLQKENEQKLAMRTAPYKQRIDHTRQRHEQAIAARRAHDQWRLSALVARQELALKNRAGAHIVERKNLAEKQGLQKAQLAQMQKLEIEQQKKQQLYEEKKRLHDFRMKQKLELARGAKKQSKSEQRKSARAAQSAQQDFVHAVSFFFFFFCKYTENSTNKHTQKTLKI